MPSSRALERRIVEVAALTSARVVVELGPGTGGTTRAILSALPADGTLLAIEIDSEFVDILGAIGDPRLIVHHGSAIALADALHQHGLGPADVVLSGIPFSTMRRDEGLAIVRSIESALAPGGRFVAYQVRDRIEALGREVFGDPLSQLEPLNVPPMRVYRWTKA